MNVHRVEVLNGDAFECSEDERVLIAMERLGKSGVAIGCRGGGCGVCRVRVISGPVRVGKMSRIHVTEDDQAAGFALACRLYPLGDIIIEARGLKAEDTTPADALAP